MINLSSSYPDTAAARSRWIVGHRGAKNLLDPLLPYAFFYEEEIGQQGDMVSTATILLTNRECPFRCLMCDLWQNTLDDATPPGAIPHQIAHAMERIGSVRQIKLYNAGSFFDPGAIPPDDYEAIIDLLRPFERVIVECHPSLIGPACARFAEQINGRLEVAMGLETVHPTVLARLNKRMTVESFTQAAKFLHDHAIDLRTFILVRPPFLSEREGVEWAKRSLDVALTEAKATVCALIPTRAGNGAMEVLQVGGLFAMPRLSSLEAVHQYGLAAVQTAAPGARIFSDVWDVERFYTCAACSPKRAARLSEMNHTQQPIFPDAPCPHCESLSE